ncbi:MAG: ATP-binding cassette domain-containing protein, partial [Candidatus Bathyarchaeia archaeon]
MVSIVLENVSKYFGNVKAVDDINLEIKDEEFLVLLGPSGCGKTTTLRMIAGLEKQTRGNIYFDGKIVNTLEPKERNIAMVFQEYALYPHMSVYDNLTLCLKVAKVPRDEIVKKVKKVSE